MFRSRHLLYCLLNFDMMLAKPLVDLYPSLGTINSYCVLHCIMSLIHAEHFVRTRPRYIFCD